jgi:hypothetical protein
MTQLLNDTLREIATDNLREKIESESPRLQFNRSRSPIHCRACGHKIPHGDFRVVVLYLNAHGHVKEHNIHFEAECMHRFGIDPKTIA